VSSYANLNGDTPFISQGFARIQDVIDMAFGMERFVIFVKK
jgi:hypothetical protein